MGAIFADSAFCHSLSFACCLRQRKFVGGLWVQRVRSVIANFKTEQEPTETMITPHMVTSPVGVIKIMSICLGLKVILIIPSPKVMIMGILGCGVC